VCRSTKLRARRVDLICGGTHRGAASVDPSRLLPGCLKLSGLARR
jgi:hypothetical protein